MSGDIFNLNSEFMRHVADDGEDDDATEDTCQTISYRDHSRISTETKNLNVYTFEPALWGKVYIRISPKENIK